jgi:hypothetical protein
MFAIGVTRGFAYKPAKKQNSYRAAQEAAALKLDSSAPGLLKAICV